jgi:hypothetical protein
MMISRSIMAVIVFLYASLSPCWAVSPNGPNNGFRIFITGAIPCGSPTQTMSWRNTYGATMQIIQIQIWNGLAASAPSDVPEIVKRRSDGAILIDGGHDDYINGGSVRIQKENWGGGATWMELPAGDWLDFTFSCSAPYVPNTGGWIVTIWTR